MKELLQPPLFLQLFIVPSCLQHETTLNFITIVTERNMASSDCRELYGMGEIEVIFWRKFISIELKGTIQPEKRTKNG
jgi:hypothetical protein